MAGSAGNLYLQLEKLVYQENEEIVYECKEERKKPGLTTVIFIALILGAAAGILIHYFFPEGYVRDNIIVGGIFEVIGTGFIRGMQMLVVPLVLCSLICGSMAIGDTKKLGKVGVKTMAFYLATTALAISIALRNRRNLINPGVGLDITSVQAQETQVAEASSLTDTLLNIIPKNPIQSLAEGNMLQIIFFALIVGILLAKRGEKAEGLANLFSQGNDFIKWDMTMAVMKVAPVGVSCLIAKTFANIGFDAFVPMLKYMAAVLVALALQCFGVYQIFLKLFTGLNPIKFVKKFLPVMGFAFSTATSNATIPLSIDTLADWGYPGVFPLLRFPLGQLSIWMELLLCRELPWYL